MKKYKIGDIVGLQSDIEGKIPDGSAPVYIVSSPNSSSSNWYNIIQVFPVSKLLTDEDLTLDDVELSAPLEDMIKLYDAGSSESQITIAFYLPPHFHNYFIEAIKEIAINKLIDELNDNFDSDDFEEDDGDDDFSISSIDASIDVDDEVRFYIDGKEFMSASMSSIEYDSEKSNNKKGTASTKIKKDDIIKYSNLKTIDECLDALNDLDILYEMFKGKVYLNKKEKVLDRLKMLVEKENAIKGV